MIVIEVKHLKLIQYSVNEFLNINKNVLTKSFLAF